MRGRRVEEETRRKGSSPLFLSFVRANQKMMEARIGLGQRVEAESWVFGSSKSRERRRGGGGLLRLGTGDESVGGGWEDFRTACGRWMGELGVFACIVRTESRGRRRGAGFTNCRGEGEEGSSAWRRAARVLSPYE
ncbi:hypothetical protein MA16_Dca002654 [Dendrobium catenatum]|uniref:Uncharacterized protein n=1 Tax=Dendrobium catenatum TaxID=906689 RepID=A0A2I0W141_9ASPA|nr:hypothetical protein MA16_Dca002654 [Dendrobium catenatum]